jgi:hypothetical protein
MSASGQKESLATGCFMAAHPAPLRPSAARTKAACTTWCWAWAGAARPGPDGRAGHAIGEIVHYTILEGLTKINVDGTVTPRLADNWRASPDGKSHLFKLSKGIRFQDGEPFKSAAVKFSFERAKAEPFRPRQADRQPLRAHRRRLHRPDQGLSLRPREGQSVAEGGRGADAAKPDGHAAAAWLGAQGRRGHRRATGHCDQTPLSAATC